MVLRSSHADFDRSWMPMCDHGFEKLLRQSHVRRIKKGNKRVWEHLSNYQVFFRNIQPSLELNHRFKIFSNWQQKQYREKHLRNILVCASTKRIEESKLVLKYPYEYKEKQMKAEAIRAEYKKMPICKSIPLTKGHFSQRMQGKKRKKGNAVNQDGEEYPSCPKVGVGMQFIFCRKEIGDTRMTAFLMNSAYLADSSCKYEPVPQQFITQDAATEEPEHRDNVVVDLQTHVSFRYGREFVCHFESAFVGEVGDDGKKALRMLHGKYREVVPTFATEGQAFRNGQQFQAAKGVPSMLSVYGYSNNTNTNGAAILLQGNLNDEDSALLSALCSSVTDEVEKSHMKYLGKLYGKDGYNTHIDFGFVQTKIDPNETRVELPHLDSSREQIYDLIQRGIFVYKVIIPFSSEGLWWELWSNENEDTVAGKKASDSLGKMVHITHGSFLVLPITTFNGGNFATTYDGSTHCQFYVTIVPKGEEKPSIQGQDKYYLYQPPQVGGVARDPMEWCRILLKTKEIRLEASTGETRQVIIRNPPNDVNEHVRTKLQEYLGYNLFV